MISVNEYVAGQLDDVVRLLEEQGASPARSESYREAAKTLRRLTEPISTLFATRGMPGLLELPGVVTPVARAIRDLVVHGRLALLDRLRGEHDPIALLKSVPGIGRVLARRLHEELGIETLEDLDCAAHDGRLGDVRSIKGKRRAAIRDWVAQRLARFRPAAILHGQPPVDELLGVDAEYRRGVDADTLPKIVPRRFNPRRQAWLPVLHASRGGHYYVAFFSNTARAHELRKTGDWVVLCYDGADGERLSTVVTSEAGRLKGLRIVRGREDECRVHYASQRPADQAEARAS